MSVNVTVMTCTGDRPDALELCRKYIERQTILPAQWLIVDDGEHGIYHKSQLVNTTYVRRLRQPGEPTHTLALNILEGLKHVERDYLVFMEDDDWYHPEFLATIIKLFGDGDLVGLGESYYYRVDSCHYRNMANYSHASLCSTAIYRPVYEVLRNCCSVMVSRGSPFVDLELWKGHGSAAVRKNLQKKDDPRRCLGIKCMPGRKGTTSGWKPMEQRRWVHDEGGKWLSETIGPEDANIYRRFASV